jgi:hypothetical protein
VEIERPEKVIAHFEEERFNEDLKTVTSHLTGYTKDEDGHLIVDKNATQFNPYMTAFDPSMGKK